MLESIYTTEERAVNGPRRDGQAAGGGAACDESGTCRIHGNPRARPGAVPSRTQVAQASASPSGLTFTTKACRAYGVDQSCLMRMPVSDCCHVNVRINKKTAQTARPGLQQVVPVLHHKPGR
jgi:hypothetical protein